MKTKVLSSLVLTGTVLVMAPQAWSQAGGASGSGAAGAGKSGSETRAQKPTDPPVSGQQRGTSGELQSERGSARGGTEGQMQGQRTAGQQLSKDKVKQIQEALKEKGNDPGQIDGIMGPKTQQALRQFQKQENLQVTGRVDEKTASALGVDLQASAAGASAPGSSASGMGSSSSEGRSGAAGSGARSGQPDSDKKGSTAGKQESTGGNPK